MIKVPGTCSLFVKNCECEPNSIYYQLYAKMYYMNNILLIYRDI